MTKDYYRHSLLEKMHALNPHIFQGVAKSIWPLLFTQNLWQDADAILAYSSLNDEVNSIPLIEHSLSAQKNVFLPYLHDQDMIFRQIFNTDLKEKHPWGFCQPARDAPLFNQEDFKSILLIAPAVAAKPSGHRLGRGKGFYDRWLAIHGQKVNTIVVILQEFLTDFPTDSFDIPFQYILSEKGLLKSI